MPRYEARAGYVGHVGNMGGAWSRVSRGGRGGLQARGAGKRGLQQGGHFLFGCDWVSV